MEPIPEHQIILKEFLELKKENSRKELMAE
jgi:hypothetical protein